MKQVWSLTFKNELGKFTFPIECNIDISGGNIIAKRNVAKGKKRGTMKERWSQDDYKITISGVFISDEPDKYPSEDLATLMKFCEAPLAIRVYCEPLQALFIDSIVIENYDLPRTKGEDSQYFQLNCLSDNDIELLIKKR